MFRLPTLRAALAFGTASMALALSAFAQTAASPIVGQTATSPVVVAQPAVQPATQPPRSYLKVDGVAGESADAAHPGWIEITSFQWGAAPTSSATRVVSRATQAAVTSIIFTKATDKTSPVLQKAAVEGKHFKTVVLEFVSRAKGEHYQITMSDAIVSSFRLNGGDKPTESVTLNFAKVDAKYGKLDAQGNRGPLQPVPSGWDIRQAVPN
jgi:type VI secretion system secreted protein Hcp